MKIYNKEEIKILLDYKETIEDEKIKKILERFLHLFNYMYLKYKEMLQDEEDRKTVYERIEKLGKENIDLKQTLDRKNRLIKTLQEKE